MSEHATLFGARQNLAGIVTDPVEDASGVFRRSRAIFFNAGLIHRVGPSRLYVTLARRLAEAGCGSARFDHAGFGDSAARWDDLPFEQSAALEGREVMDALQGSNGVDRFILIGLCSGAVTAFETALADPRVVGVVLINPQGFDDSSEWNRYVMNRGAAHRYWSRAIFDPSSWWKALSGRADYRRLVRVLWDQVTSRIAPAPGVTAVTTRVAAGLKTLVDRRVRLLLLCSEGDAGIEYMNVILGADLRRGGGTDCLDVRILAGADHSLTLMDSQRRVVTEIVDWTCGVLAGPIDAEPVRADVSVPAAFAAVR
jgi:pimeloyl-ACP methyl ester carboxylesterase